MITALELLMVSAPHSVIIIGYKDFIDFKIEICFHYSNLTLQSRTMVA
jgi:hypothetical protein